MGNVELLGIVSFCVLMEGHDGILGKAPNYIAEKFPLMKHPAYMLNALDSYNKAKVMEWGKRWKIDFEGLDEQIGKDYWDIPASEFKEKYSVK